MGSDASAQRATSATAYSLYIEHFSIPYNTSLTVETTNLLSGADPVMHLMRDSGGGSYTQVAYNDNYSGLNARIAYTNGNPVLSSNFILIIRAKTVSNRGSCDLLKGGSSRRTRIPVGGNFMASSSLTFGSGDELRTVHDPGGSVAQVLLKFSTSTGYTINGVAITNGVGGVAVLPVSGAEYHLLVGTPWVQSSAGYVKPRVGSVRLMANDIGSDTDGDGVGNSLESALSLCSGTSGCPNNGTGHGRDTDRDGLTDGEELWGVAGTLTGGVDDLPLSRWGANPRKKDVFVEVDFLTGTGHEVFGDTTNPFEYLRANPSDPRGSPEAWFATLQAPYTTAPNTHIKNPDSSAPAVAIHLDIGVPPLSAADEAKFGAWSSGSARALVPDFIFKGLGPIDGDFSLELNGWEWVEDMTGWTGAQIAAFVGLAAITSGEPVQLKSYTDHGDGTGTAVIESSVPGLHFSRSVVAAGFEDAFAVPSESEQSLRSHYENDPNQVDAARLGITRYAVMLGGLGQALGARFVTDSWPGTFAHELGHTLDLKHWGHNDWGTTGPDCLPHYLSLMRYGGGPYQFSTTDGVDLLNPAETFETQTFGPGYNHAIYSGSPYNYTATSTTVDWNRNGAISGVYDLWRSFALSLKDGDCRAFVQGRQSLGSTETVEGSPDLIRVDGRVYAFWATGSALKYRFATLGAKGDKSCTGDADGLGACLTWSSTHTLYSGASYLGVTAHELDGSVFVGFFDDENGLYMSQLSVGGTGTLVEVDSWAVTKATSNTRTSVTPEFVRRYHQFSAGDLVLLYLAEAGHYRSFRWDGTDFVSDGPLYDENSVPIQGGDSPAALAWSGPGFATSEKRTLALLPNTSGAVRLFELDYATGEWHDLNVTGLESTSGKPILAYRHLRQEDGEPLTDFDGHFLVGWMKSCLGTERCAYVRPTGLVSRDYPPASGLSFLNAGDWHSNHWASVQEGTSLALYSDATLDSVFGLGAYSVASEVGLNFFPHSDGSPNRDFGIRSDFRVMEDGICRRIAEYRGFTCGTIYVVD